MEQSAWTGSVIRLIRKLCSSSVTAESHRQVNYLDLEKSLQRLKSWTGTTLSLLPKKLFSPYSKLGNVYAYIPFGSFNRRYMDAKDVSDASEHAKTMEGGWAYFLPLPVLQSSEESRRVSSTNSFKRSQGPWGLSFLLKPAKGSAISLLKLTGHWVSHESRQQYASSTSLNQTIELVWATSFARSGNLQTTNGFIKFWPVWADTYNALPV